MSRAKGNSRARLARGFDFAAHTLHKQSWLLLSSVPKGSHTDPVMLKTVESSLGCTFGSMVLQSFSVELILKSILIRLGISPPKHHNLAKLFALLPENVREAAERNYVRIIGTSTKNMDVLSVALSKSLQQNSNAFEEFRYMDEHCPQRARIGELQNAFTALHEIFMHDQS